MRFLALIVVIFCFSCQQTPEEKGEALAKQNCGSCHKFPDPSLLDKKTWNEGVLPEMAYRLGIGNRFELLTKIPDEQYQSAMRLDIYPETPKISQEDWDLIVAYYTAKAPEKPLPQPKRSPISSDLLHFKRESFISPADPMGAVTSIRIHPQKSEVWVGTRMHKLWILDEKLKIKQTIQTPTPIVHTQFVGKNAYAVGIGKLYPNDQHIGQLVSIDENKKQVTLADSLTRPVDVQLADFNQDGTTDYLICEFGFEAGKLSWVDGKTKKKNNLKVAPGARNVVVKDFTGDGKPDFMVLMAQAREGVSLYINKSSGIFVEKPLLQFESVSGSNYMEVADFNQDGFDDIMITNGDNADYSYAKKGYHGVRIYLNDKRYNFKEAFFYPVYGAYKTLARDFDQDGDLDLAMIAFFAENDQGKIESFLYFQNQGNLKFNVSNLQIPGDGHYIAMDAGDVDHDGDIDILLGNYQFGNRKPGANNTPGLQLTYYKNLLR